jgi:hypothetical protein
MMHRVVDRRLALTGLLFFVLMLSPVIALVLLGVGAMFIGRNKVEEKVN